MARAPVVLAWSGGKDSALTLQALRADPAVEPVALLTTVTREYDRISMHGVRRSLLLAQATAAGLPLVQAIIPAAASNEAYESAMRSALATVRERFPLVRHVAFGDLFLADVRAYRERQMAHAGMVPLFPIWGLDTRVLAERFIDEGFEAVLACVDTQQLPAAFAGRAYDRNLVRDLPATADPCGENGEFHTFVAAGPVLATRVPYVRGEVVLRDGRFAYCDLLSGA